MPEPKFLRPTAYSLQPTASSFCLCGPTSVGKSALALLLAKRLGGQIVGADAFQIYEGLPILTAQPLLQERQAIRHHLIGVVPPTEPFDVFRYRTMALAAIEEILSRKKIPFIVGGTGLYFRALLTPFDPLPQADEALRMALKELSLEELLLRLHSLDPEATKLIDIKNRRRIERAIEIVTTTKLPLAKSWHRHQEPASSKTPPPRGLLLIRDRAELFERIENNVQQMFADGVVEEVAAVLKNPLSSTASMALGLREIKQLLLGKQSLQETKAAIILATKRYAKRQLTWFRYQHSFPCLNLSHFSSLDAAAEEALKWL
ncbi:MAG: tRNA (adenosine(37)-N6)-dimethylallyltransferase MiaA [Chthoniobacterales bacterium]|nr:tRNA (adenosine(37)-N6)-dimethylallyltransferase MiaA [Chthoniobacterales bacterium]